MAKKKNPVVFLDVAIGDGPVGRMVFEVLFHIVTFIFKCNNRTQFSFHFSSPWFNASFYHFPSHRFLFNKIWLNIGDLHIDAFDIF